MKLRWCILLGVIVLIGIASQQQVGLPNQEIVLRFNNDEVTSTETQNAIAIVKKQLLAIGANNIQVKESPKGDLKITYHSDTDVASIKKMFSDKKNIELGVVASNLDNKPVKLPSKEHTQSYNIDVFEIKNQHTGFDIGATLVLDRKLETTRSFIPNVSTSGKNFGFINKECVLKETYKFRKNIAITIEITSNKIPEGRAGPNKLQYHS